MTQDDDCDEQAAERDDCPPTRCCGCGTRRSKLSSPSSLYDLGRLTGRFPATPLSQSGRAHWFESRVTLHTRLTRGRTPHLCPTCTEILLREFLLKIQRDLEEFSPSYNAELRAAELAQIVADLQGQIATANRKISRLEKQKSGGLKLKQVGGEQG